jgi:hypothetical protein
VIIVDRPGNFAPVIFLKKKKQLVVKKEGNSYAKIHKKKVETGGEI